MVSGISFILLAYNEGENLKKIIPKIRHYADTTDVEYEIIVVDTAEPTDDSEIVCHECGAIYMNQSSPGFGGALMDGIQAASMERIITIDSDGAHDPSYIPTMVKEFNSRDVDVVIGSRYVRGGGTNDPWHNVMMSRLLNVTYSHVLHLSAKDLSTNFRMYRTSDIQGLKLDCVNYDILQEILIKMRCRLERDIQIYEFPIVLQKRISGQSKRKLFTFIRSYIVTLMKLKAIENR